VTAHKRERKWSCQFLYRLRTGNQSLINPLNSRSKFLKCRAPFKVIFSNKKNCFISFYYSHNDWNRRETCCVHGEFRLTAFLFDSVSMFLLSILLFLLFLLSLPRCLYKFVVSHWRRSKIRIEMYANKKHLKSDWIFLGISFYSSWIYCALLQTTRLAFTHLLPVIYVFLYWSPTYHCLCSILIVFIFLVFATTVVFITIFVFSLINYYQILRHLLYFIFRCYNLLIQSVYF